MLTSHQRLRVTSRRLAHSRFCCTGSKQQTSNHKHISGPRGATHWELDSSLVPTQMIQNKQTHKHLPNVMMLSNVVMSTSDWIQKPRSMSTSKWKLKLGYIFTSQRIKKVSVCYILSQNKSYGNVHVRLNTETTVSVHVRMKAKAMVRLSVHVRWPTAAMVSVHISEKSTEATISARVSTETEAVAVSRSRWKQKRQQPRGLNENRSYNSLEV